MATYNGERFLRCQLDSILSCLTPNDELVVSDDGSTDGTLEILKRYADTSSVPIHIIEGPHRGVVANFGNALAHAKGDIVFLSDQDDVWHEDKVVRVLAAFSDSSCSVVVHDARIVDSEQKATGETLFQRRHSRPGFLKNIVKNSYVGCCMAMKRNLLQAIMPIPENIEMHDWWIGLVSEMVGSSTFIDDQLIDYRRHSNNVSRMSHYPICKMVAIRWVMLRELAKRRRILRAGESK